MEPRLAHKVSVKALKPPGEPKVIQRVAGGEDLLSYKEEVATLGTLLLP